MPPVGSSDPKKQKRAAAQRARTQAPEARMSEAKRKVMTRIRRGDKILLTTLNKYDISVDEYNTTRIMNGFEPIPESNLKGYRPSEVQNVIEQLVELNSEIHIAPSREQRAETVLEIESNVPRMDKITLNDYSRLLLETGRDKKSTVDGMVRRVKQIITGLGSNDDNDDIVKYLKRIDRVEEVIDNLRQKDGSRYASNAPFWKAISAALNRGGNGPVIPFMNRFTQEEINFYNSRYQLTNSREEVVRDNTVNRGRMKETPDWSDVKPKIDKYIVDKGTNLEKRVIASIYSGRLPGIPRSNTFTDLHYVTAIGKATDKSKNYIVLNGKSCILVSNTHKTGVSTDSKRNKGGKAIMLRLHEKKTNFYKGLVTRLRELVKMQPKSDDVVILKVGRNYITEVLKEASGYDNQQLRRSVETYYHKNGSDNQIALVALFHGHSIATAFKHYIRDSEKEETMELFNKFKNSYLALEETLSK